MATTNHKAYTAAIATALSTEFNALANGGTTAASSAIDNSTNRDLFMDMELYVAAQGSARTLGGTINVYIVRSIDGTNYDDTATAELLTMFFLDNTTTARRMSKVDIPVPPGSFKLFAYNGTGQALAASGTTLKVRFHSIATA